VIWQRIPARRAAAALHGDAGPVTRQIPMMRQEPRPQSGCVPRMVVREPEAAWWRAQAELDQVAPAGPTTTVAILHERDAGTDAAADRLAELAVADELLVVFGSASHARPDPHPMITELRNRLPRHDVVPVHVAHRGAGGRWQAALDRFLDAGHLPIVVTASAYLQEVTAEVSSYVRADRVLRVFGTTTRAELHQVWRRAEPSVN